MALKFFKIPKHQRFDYKPRFWDADKEDLEKRMKASGNSKETDAEAMKARISSRLRSRGGYHPGKRDQSKQLFRSNMILLASVVILVILSFIIIQVYLPKILQMFK